MELGGYLEIARRWFLLLVASVVFAAVGGYAVASTLPAVYQAETRILVGPLSADLDIQRAAGQLAHTYAQLVPSHRVTDAVIRRLALDIRPVDLQNAITAVPNDLTRLVTIRVENRDPELAAQLANALADELSALSSELRRPEGQTQVVDPAEAPTRPVWPQVTLLILLAALAGLLIGIAGVVWVEYLRDSLASEEELRELTGAPVLGELPVSRGLTRGLASNLLNSKLADRYRIMTLRLENSLGDNNPRSLLIANVTSENDAATVAVGLALSFADRGVATALIDGNSDAPEATRIIGLTPEADRRELIAGGQIPMAQVSFVGAIKRFGSMRRVSFTAVPSGAGQELGTADELEAIMARVAEIADVVVITSQPLDRSSEALLWARQVDAVVLVVPMPARRRDINTSVEALQVAGLKLAGSIITKPSRIGNTSLLTQLDSRRPVVVRAAGPSELATAADPARGSAGRSGPSNPRIE